jgi:Putative porin
MLSKAYCVTLAVICVLSAPSMASQNATEKIQELQNLRQRLEAQEIELREQRREINELKATLQQLVNTPTRNDNAGNTCKAAIENCSGKQNANSATTPAQEASNAQTAANVASEDISPSRFTFGGDVRMRFESITQDLTPNRYRTRLRVRFGVESALSQDLKGGFYLATGTLDDPVSANVTLSQFFTRKTIGIDRGWITYQPVRHKWLEVTGGKFTPNWQRSSLSLDPDLNPEGFQEKLSFEVKNPFLKKVTLSGMQLLLNELPGSVLPVSSGADSYAFGGQFGAQLQLGRRVKTKLYASGLNWQNTDAVIQAISTGSLGGNRNTNATIGTGASVQYASKFLYADFIADTTFDTGFERWPLSLTIDYLRNPRAASDQNQGFWSELAMGRLANRNEVSFGYAFGRIEQDAVIAAFNESELRAPTNVVQHKLLLQWVAQKNTTVSFTGWIGRTLNRNLQNAALPPTLAPDAQDPWVKRLQLDVSYKF